MAQNSPVPTPRHMPLRQRWQQTSLANKLTILLAALALVVSSIGTGVTIYFSFYFSRQQAEMNSTVATFEANVQATSEYQYSQQFNIQQTQIAMQSEMDAWYRRQSLPLIDVVIPPEHIFVVQKVAAEQVASGYVIKGEGVLEMVLANNGGGRAGMVNIDWVNETQNNIVLHSELYEVGNSHTQLPSTIDAQTPVRVQLLLKASVPYAEDPTGKSDYQLGAYWKKEVSSHPNHLAIRFSNTDPLEVKIKDIELAMPETVFQPTPGSWFLVTNKTPITVRCFKTDGKDIPVKIRYLENDQEIQATVEDKDCNSFPVGSYRIIIWDASNNTSTESITFTLTPEGTATIDLTRPESGLTSWFDRFENQFANNTSLVTAMGLLSALLLWFFPIEETGFVELYRRNGTSSSLLWIKSVHIRRWGTTIRPRIPEIAADIATVKIRKQSENLYLLKIDGQSGKTREVTLRDTESFILPSSTQGELEIRLRGFGKTGNESGKER